MSQRLYRSRRERIVFGIAGGLAEYLGIDPTVVRVLWLLLALVSGGVFALLYLLMVFIVPEEPAGVGWPDRAATEAGPPAGEGTPEGRPGAPAAAGRGGALAATRDRGSFALGILLIVIGAAFAVQLYFPWLEVGRLWPLILIAFGLVLVVSAVRRSRD
jgi:phage shock protein C